MVVLYMNQRQIILHVQPKNLVKQGVRLIGGCCGTTPKHIEAAKKRLAKLTPLERKNKLNQASVEFVRVPEPRKHEPLHEKAKRERSVIVELDTPRHLEIDGVCRRCEGII